MAKGFFRIGNTSTDAFGVGVSGYQVYNAPSRDIEAYHIPGRNGDVLADKGCYNNRPIVYNCFLAHTFKDDFDDFRDWLTDHMDRYYWLDDSYHPEHLYLARVVGPLDPKVSVTVSYTHLLSL